MAINIQIATIADSISKLSIAGVTIKDINELSASWKSLPNVLYPRPNNFITNVALTAAVMSKQKYDLHYVLNYRFLNVQVGSDAVMFATYPELIAKVVLIANAIITNHNLTGAIDVSFGGITDIGALPDPAGNVFHGCDFQINVLEYLEA